MTNYCLNILNHEGSWDEINHTNIVLLPKRLNLVDMTHYRSISLCNVLLRIITKAIMYRL